jgi:hypothetical protein
MALPILDRVANPLFAFVMIVAIMWLFVERPLARGGHRFRRIPPFCRVKHRFSESESLRTHLTVRWLVFLRRRIEIDREWVKIGRAVPIWVERSVVREIVGLQFAGKPCIRFASESGAYDGVLVVGPRSSGRLGDLLASMNRLGWPLGTSALEIVAAAG